VSVQEGLNIVSISIHFEMSSHKDYHLVSSFYSEFDPLEMESGGRQSDIDQDKFYLNSVFIKERLIISINPFGTGDHFSEWIQICLLF
jgi:hypothetical protein